MGELVGKFSDSPEGQIARDKEIKTGDKTDIPGFKDLKCDGLHPVDKHPIFSVTHQEFYQNTSHGRQRLRFKSGSDVQRFQQNGRYRQPFYLKHDKNGYIRKIK